MFTKTARINSKLYFDLFDRGGDKLIAVYSILKTSRNNQIKYYAYKASNNKTVSGFGLLKAKTNLPLNTIKKYVPVLIDMGLCYIDKNGDFVILGGEKTKELYSCTKLVPIKIGRNLIDTAANSFVVRLHSKQKAQEIQIQKKKYLSELQGKAKYSNDAQKKLKKMLNFSKAGETSLTDNILLSNKGFATLNKFTDNKSSGQYYKRVLKNKGLISTERRYKRISQLSYNDYKSLRNNNCISSSQLFNNGWLIEELVSSFSILP